MSGPWSQNHQCTICRHFSQFRYSKCSRFHSILLLNFNVEFFSKIILSNLNYHTYNISITVKRVTQLVCRMILTISKKDQRCCRQTCPYSTSKGCFVFFLNHFLVVWGVLFYYIPDDCSVCEVIYHHLIVVLYNVSMV